MADGDGAAGGEAAADGYYAAAPPMDAGDAPSARPHTARSGASYGAQLLQLQLQAAAAAAGQLSNAACRVGQGRDRGMHAQARVSETTFSRATRRRLHSRRCSGATSRPPRRRRRRSPRRHPRRPATAGRGAAAPAPDAAGGGRKPAT